jgi:hypothetical protein
MPRESVYDQMSRAEKKLANVLKNRGIQWAYEQPVFENSVSDMSIDSF